MSHHPSYAVIGGGPAGLRAAEILAGSGASVTLYDAMPALGRKFLMAGRGGLNLTHSEPLDRFIPRYGNAAEKLSPAIHAFTPDALRDWCHGLGQETFVGSSGRVFPQSLKASPLLRAWLRQLDTLGVRFALRHRWQGWNKDGALIFTDAQGQTVTASADATILALGGASWPKLGSDGGWAEILRAQAIAVTPLRPANCGFIVPWSDNFATRFAGQPLKPVALSFAGQTLQGEAMITQRGIEGSAIYALSARLRNAIEATGSAILHLDLRPGLSHEILAEKLAAARGSQSLSNFLRKAAGLSPVAIGLLRENWPTLPADPAALAAAIKHTPVTVTSSTGLDRAISTAGGVAWDEIDAGLMLKKKPGVFVAGEMLDWEAPTGGYLLQGCFSTATLAAQSAGLSRESAR